MYKKIILLLVFIGLFILNHSNSHCNSNLNCKFDDKGNVSSSIESCLSDATILKSNDMSVTGGFKNLIVNYINKISTILAILAVGSIAYGSMVIVSSFGSDEKIKKGRNIIKWSLIGFLILVSAAGIIKLIIYIMYGL